MLLGQRRYWAEHFRYVPCDHFDLPLGGLTWKVSCQAYFYSRNILSTVALNLRSPRAYARYTHSPKYLVRTSLSCSFVGDYGSMVNPSHSVAINSPCMSVLSTSTRNRTLLVAAASQIRRHTWRGVPISSKPAVELPTEPPELPYNRFYVESSDVSDQKGHRAAVGSTLAHSFMLTASVRSHSSDGVLLDWK